MSSRPPLPRGGAGRVIAAAGATTTESLIGQQSRRSVITGRVFFLFVLFCAMVGVIGLVTLITEFPSSLPLNAGYQSAIAGTFIVMAGVFVTVVPLGVGAAIYLEEYADNNKWYNRIIEVNIANLAAVPSIVFGILGLAFIVRGPLSFGPVAYAGSLTLSLLVLPTVILASREALRAVPDTIRQASLALGATKMQTIRKQTLPAAIPGIATGTILAMARAIGETAPLLLVGATVFVTFNPSGPFDTSGYTAMPVQIFNYVSRAQEEFQILAAAGIILLLVLLMVVNAFAIWLRNKYQRKW